MHAQAAHLADMCTCLVPNIEPCRTHSLGNTARRAFFVTYFKHLFKGSVACPLSTVLHVQTAHLPHCKTCFCLRLELDWSVLGLTVSEKYGESWQFVEKQKPWLKNIRPPFDAYLYSRRVVYVSFLAPTVSRAVLWLRGPLAGSFVSTA